MPEKGDYVVLTGNPNDEYIVKAVLDNMYILEDRHRENEIKTIIDLVQIHKIVKPDWKSYDTPRINNAQDISENIRVIDIKNSSDDIVSSGDINNTIEIKSDTNRDNSSEGTAEKDTDISTTEIKAPEDSNVSVKKIVIDPNYKSNTAELDAPI